jgi:hypothetical protein
MILAMFANASVQAVSDIPTQQNSLLNSFASLKKGEQFVNQCIKKTVTRFLFRL